MVNECTSYPDAKCVANYCDGCWADYYLNGELINCSLSVDCLNLTGIDFGVCAMVLGIGLVNDNCTSISGCGWVVDSVDYSYAFFNSMDNCIEACLSASNDEINQLHYSFFLNNNYPNPFNPITTLRYELPKQVHVRITIYDMLGRKIRTILNNAT